MQPLAIGGRTMAWMLPLLPGMEDDALWGGVVEIVDANGCTWRYCGVTPGCVVGGDVAAGDVIGVVAAIPAEADLASHVHLECLKDGTWMKPEI